MPPSRLLSLTALAILQACSPSSTVGSEPTDPTATNFCINGALDVGEVDIDCGGACATCAMGKRCAADADCTSGECGGASVCVASDCGNLVKDGLELGVDCGGDCPGCLGAACTGPTECASGFCTAAGCDVPSCTDGVQNGAESDVDCGGGGCPLCGIGKHCIGGTQCVAETCIDLTCTTPTCADGVRNQGERGIDCGTPCGPCPCADPKFEGENCDQCADKRFTGVACDQCVDPLRGGPTCEACKGSGFALPACTSCRPGYQGTDCNVPICAAGCGSGTCTAPNTCDCAGTGYSGARCETPECNIACEHGATCATPNVCNCSGTGYTGAHCETPACTPSCANGGDCVAPNTCDCAGTGYTGASCSTATCTQPCQHGVCSAPDTCNCGGTGYAGPTCAIPVCTTPCAHGGTCVGPDTCDCTGTGYAGATCATPVCASGCGHGTCTAPNTCACNEGYSGATCNAPICALSCGAHGTCTAPNTCTCASPYFGAQCGDRGCDDSYDCLASEPICDDHATPSKCVTFVNDACATLEPSDADDGPSVATPLPLGVTQAGVFCGQRDTLEEDWYVVTIAAAGVLAVTVTSERRADDLDVWIAGNGGPYDYARDDTDGTGAGAVLPSDIALMRVVPGTYYVTVRTGWRSELDFQRFSIRADLVTREVAVPLENLYAGRHGTDTANIDIGAALSAQGGACPVVAYVQLDLDYMSAACHEAHPMLSVDLPGYQLRFADCWNGTVVSTPFDPVAVPSTTQGTGTWSVGVANPAPYNDVSVSGMRLLVGCLDAQTCACNDPARPYCDPRTGECRTCDTSLECPADHPICDIVHPSDFVDDVPANGACIAIDPCVNDDTHEPGDDGPSGATPVSIGDTIGDHKICAVSGAYAEEDWYALSLGPDDVALVTLTAMDTSHFEVMLVDAGLGWLTQVPYFAPSAGSSDPLRLPLTNLPAGEYFLVVRSTAAATVVTTPYTLSLTAVSASGGGGTDSCTDIFDCYETNKCTTQACLDACNANAREAHFALDAAILFECVAGAKVDYHCNDAYMCGSPPNATACDACVYEGTECWWGGCTWTSPCAVPAASCFELDW